MKMPSSRFFWLLGGVAYGMAIDVCAQGGTKACDEISIDSAGVHGFKHSEVEAVARSHGLKGVADFVLIVPPSIDTSVDTSIKELIVMADVRPMPEARCGKFVDPEGELVNCAQSIKNQGLKIIVKFKGNELDKYQKQMPLLASYIANEVLCLR